MSVTAPDTATFERIVVAYDGSERSLDALALAQRLREPASGTMTLACVPAPQHGWHVRRRDRGTPADEGAVEAMLADARHAMPAGIRVQTRSVAATSPARGLTELAESEGADLVVVGSSTRSADGRIELERTAGRLLSGAPCAVAVAPAGLRDTDAFRHVGIAFDGTPEARAALAAGYAIAARDHAAVTVFRGLVRPTSAGAMAGAVGEEAQRIERRHAEEDLDAAAESAPPGVNPRTVLLAGEPGPAIARAADGIVDLLVCGSRSYGPVQRALVGSVSSALLERATHPVLVLPRAPGQPA
jgi:nucleotide-binding universal stress UspA family protein